MSLLEKRPNVQYEKFTLKIQKQTSEMLRRYGQFVNRQQADVIDGLLQFAFSRDSEFKEWLKSQPEELPRPIRRQKKPIAASAAL
jgi:hypothetical protein